MTGRDLSKSKQILFTCIALLIPLLFFAVIEFALFLFQYGGPVNLVIPHETEKKYYRFNYQIGKKYFPKYQVATAISYDAFLKEKPENGYRIFVLGGSTAAGYPYMNNGAFSRMLRTRLEVQFPDKTIEVMNAAMPAVNSFTVLDFVKELVNYEPDAFFFYMGHNEYYGALGAGSADRLSDNRPLIQLYLGLSHFRTVRLLRDIIWDVRGWFVKKPDTGDATLMERMVGKDEITLGDDVYKLGVSNFQTNLNEMIQIANKHQIACILSELPSNLRDQKPFISIYNNEVHRDYWETLIQNSIDQYNDGQYREVIQHVETAMTDSINPAMAYFLLGRCHEKLKEYHQAKACYLQAKKMDGLRFRAPEAMNKVVHEIGKQNDIPVVPLTQIYETNSPNELIGDNLMTDHLHPNIEGFYLMADGFFNVMQENGFIQDHWDASNTMPESVAKQHLGLTATDSLLAVWKIDILKGGWPFVKRSKINNAMIKDPQTKLEKVTWKWIKHKYNWESAHVQMADHYKNQRQFAKAAKEFEALMIGTPYNVSPYLHVAEMSIILGDYMTAFNVLKKSLKIEDSFYANKWIGSITLNNGNAKEALPFLQKAIKEKPDDHQVMYNLSGALYQSGHLKKAIQWAERLYDVQPDYPNLKPFLSGIKAAMKSTQK